MLELYWGILALGRFGKDLAKLGLYDLGPIFTTTAFALALKEVSVMSSCPELGLFPPIYLLKQ